ncbi:hypothetical protein ACLOJK_001093 [Asimina triloba]
MTDEDLLINLSLPKETVKGFEGEGKEEKRRLLSRGGVGKEEEEEVIDEMYHGSSSRAKTTIFTKQAAQRLVGEGFARHSPIKRLRGATNGAANMEEEA